MSTIIRPPSTVAVVETGHEAPRRPRRRRGAAGALALVPFVLFLLVFAIYPLANLLSLALSDTKVENAVFVSTFSGLSNFARVLADPGFWDSAAVTLAFVASTVSLTIIGGVILAFLVDRSVWLQGVARNVLIWPAVVTPVVVSVIWLLVLSPTVGGLNRVLATFGVPEQGWLNSGIGAFTCVVVLDLWHWTPIVFLFVFTALKGIPHEIIEAARVDGARESQIIWRVILPSLRPAIVVVGLVRVVMSVKAFDEMFLLTAGGPDGATNLISLHIRQGFFDRLDFGFASSESVTVVVATLLIVGAALLIRRRTPRKDAA